MTVATTTRARLLVVTLAIVWISTVSLIVGASDRSEPRDKGASPGANAARQAAANYAGQDTCLTCHADRDYRGTAHARKANPKTPAASHGCESCHGPGKEHADSGGDKALIKNPNTLPPADVSGICTTCHNSGDHEFWNHSPHNRRSLTCTTCHSMHDPESLEKQLKASSVIQTCGKCHRDKLAKLDRSGHMPVREGKIECSTCHNPHGSQNVRMLRVGNSINETCWSCHPEKRGPFLWEHAPVRENCTTCHDPHGSANERSLVAKLPFLCQRCHTHNRHPSTIYDSTQLRNSTRLYNRACVNCHSNIHGSNHPSGHTFTR